MYIQPVRLTLLNHLFYYTEVSGGGTSATITGAFLGDLALTYALHKTLYDNEHHYEMLTNEQPAYKDLQTFPFYCTVGKPTSNAGKSTKQKIQRTENYTRNTLFNVDGYIDMNALAKTAASPFKNYRQVQGIAIGTAFDALILSKEKLPILPPTVRIGTGRETLVGIETIKMSEKDTYWLNAYTLKMIFGNLPQAVEMLMAAKKMNLHYVLEQYQFIKDWTPNEIQTLFKDVF